MTLKHSTNILTLTLCAAAMACGSDGGGTPLGPDAPPDLGAQIDRNGRPAINTALVATFEGDDVAKGAAKDAYNAAAPAQWGSFRDEFIGNLAILDSLDENCGNQLIADAMPLERYGALADVLTDDQIYVNTDSGTCGTYLGLEAEVVGAVGAGAGGCGGRMLDDDVIERSYSVLAAGMLVGVDDTITANDVTNSTMFPFLAAPQ